VRSCGPSLVAWGRIQNYIVKEGTCKPTRRFPLALSEKHNSQIGDESRVTGLDPPRAASADMGTPNGVILHRSENLR
jgi:hypothetical protein